MTERLYYADPSLLSFEGRVIAVFDHKGRPSVVLDRSAFYPTSGGQSYDTGTLGAAAVVDVIEQDDGTVLHVISGDAPVVGATLVGQIDRTRRTIHRQIHTAQHVLSQAFIRVCNLETVSVHLGEDYGAIELPKFPIDEIDIGKAERLAQEIIARALSVHIHFATQAELTSFPLRKAPMREGAIRIIQIGDFDYSACGGTHLHNTSEIGVLKIIAVEKQRGNSLVKFLAGDIARIDYTHKFSVTNELSRALTCSTEDLVSKVQKLRDENSAYRSEITRLTGELLPVYVERYVANVQTAGTTPCVFLTSSPVDTSSVNLFAGQLAARIAGVVGIVVGEKLVVACATSSGKSAQDLVKQLAASNALRGGGNAQLAQLGGISNENQSKILTDLTNAIATST